jgi:hypothetical protein
MISANRPVDCHPALTDERLQVLAQFIAEVVERAASSHAVSEGDGNWGLGCKRFERIVNCLLREHVARRWEWFGVVNPGKRFVFSVGDVPVRFYRGKPDRAPARTLAVHTPELRQLSLAFDGLDAAYKELLYRFAIETGPLGEPVSIIFAALAKDDGAVVFSWDIPFNSHGLEEQIPAQESPDMVEIEPAPIGIPDQADTERRDVMPR